MDELYKLFDNKAVLYAESRPGYSAHVLQYLQNDLGLSSTALGADIGCGTGQLTKILSAFFESIYAVEPNVSMISECQKRLHDKKNIKYKYRSAESTDISDNILDYITVAQAFHLLSGENTLREFKRILKPDGKLIIIYNMKNHFSDLFIKSEEVLLKYCPLYRRDFHAKEFKYDSFLNCFTEDSYQYRFFLNDNTEYLDCKTFIDRTLSASYAVQADDPSFPTFVKELEKVFAYYSTNNKIKMELSTVIYSGNLG